MQVQLDSRKRATTSPGHDASHDREDDVVETISNDLKFLLPLLRKFPKCYWIWKYRLWLLDLATELLPPRLARQFWEQELGLVGKMLALDSRNFHGWEYRRTVVEALRKPASLPQTDTQSLTEQEFGYTTKMVNANLSNFSAWHNRSKLIPRLLDERGADKAARQKMLEDGKKRPEHGQKQAYQYAELEFIQRALWAGDNDSSLWFYHQYLMCTFDPRQAPSSIAPDLTDEERQNYLLEEIEKVLEMEDGAEDCKWIYQALVSMSVLYRKLTGAFPPQAAPIEGWLKTLDQIDGLRAGRWRDMRQRLQSQSAQSK